MAPTNEGPGVRRKKKKVAVRKKRVTPKTVSIDVEEEVVEVSAPEPVAKKAGPARRETAASSAANSSRAALAAPFRATRSVRKKDITVFLRQLIMMLEAGMPILKAIKTLSHRGSRSGVRGLVGDIAQYVENGNPLWQAFDRHSNYFDPVFVNLIKASEASGTLIPVLKRLTFRRERREMMTKRVRAAIVYPVLLVIACTLVVLILTKFVLPQFKEIFAALDVELPPITKATFAVSDFAESYWWMFLVALIACVVLYKFWILRQPLLRLRAHKMIMKIPILGKIYQGDAIANFTRTFSILLRSGLSMMATLDLVRNAVNNQAFVNAIQAIRDTVERGESIEGPMREHSAAFPAEVTDMLVTGEESGSLDNITEQLADTYEEDVQIRLATIGETFTPVITGLAGVIVLILAVALFLPLISMMDTLMGSA